MTERKPAQRLAYSPAEVGALIGCHRKTVIEWIHDGTLQARQIKGKWFVPASELVRLLGCGVESGVGKTAEPEKHEETAF